MFVGRKAFPSGAMLFQTVLTFGKLPPGLCGFKFLSNVWRRQQKQVTCLFIASLPCRVLPFQRTAISEMFVLHVTGLGSLGQPPVTGLGAAGRSSLSTRLIAPGAELALGQASRQCHPTAALGRVAGMLWERIHFFLPSHPAEAGPWERRVFCCGRSAKGWLWERGSWRRRLGGAGFPAIVGEIFLLCFGRDCLTVAEAVSAATGLLGRWWLLLPVPVGLPVLSKRVSVVPVSAAMFQPEDVGRDPAVGNAAGWLLGS